MMLKATVVLDVTAQVCFRHARVLEDHYSNLNGRGRLRALFLTQKDPPDLTDEVDIYVGIRQSISNGLGKIVRAWLALLAPWLLGLGHELANHAHELIDHDRPDRPVRGEQFAQPLFIHFLDGCQNLRPPFQTGAGAITPPPLQLVQKALEPRLVRVCQMSRFPQSCPVLFHSIDRPLYQAAFFPLVVATPQPIDLLLRGHAGEGDAFAVEGEALDGRVARASHDLTLRNGTTSLFAAGAVAQYRAQASISLRRLSNRSPRR